MGVGLYLTGVVGVPSGDPLEHIERFVQLREGDDLLYLERDVSRLFLQNHPAAEPVEFSLEGSRLTVSARTSTVGPGYHADLCELLHDLGGQLSIRWDPPSEDEGDETEYFHTRDRAELERQMLLWLSKVAELLLEHGEANTNLQMSMPTAPRYKGPPGTWLMTQLGPRSRAWTQAVVADPKAGIDVFPWWEPGKGAAAELGRVLVHFWMDVRWHEVATEDEEALAHDLSRRLARAYQLDPTLDYPWRAWQRLIDEVIGASQDDLTATIRESARQQPDEPVGYRLYPVEEELPGGWKLTIPGSFSHEVDEEGTWSAWEEGVTVWASAFGLPEMPEPLAMPVGDLVPEDGEPVKIEALEKPELRYCAFRSPHVEDDEEYWQVQVQILEGSRLLLLTVVVPDESQIDWACEMISTVSA